MANASLPAYEYHEAADLIERQAEDIAEVKKQAAIFERGHMAAESQIDEMAEEIAGLRRDYLELIYAVGNKWPGETRHQTALRYIYNAEHQAHGPSQAAAAQGKEKP